MSEVRETLLRVVADQLRMDERDINDGSNFRNDLNADDLDMMEILQGAEEAFDIEIPDDEIPTFKTFGEAVTYFKKKTS